MNALLRDLRDLPTRAGEGWTRFWFTPSDPYTSGVMRIAVGLLAFWWLALWTLDIERIYGPQGFLPLEAMRQWRGGRGFSVLSFASNSGLLWSIHALALAAAVMFTIGLFTRISSVLTAALLVSYMWRAPLVCGEMEYILAMLAIYLCIGPCGAELSIDKWLADRRLRQDRVLSGQAATPRLSSWTTVSMRLVQIHLSAIFFAMALAKCRGATWWQGEAIWWMAARPDSRLIDFTGLLAGKLDVVNFLTHVMLIFEFAFAILVWNRSTRSLMLALSVPLWIAVAVLTGMVGYSLLMLIASLAFVSSATLRACCDSSNGVASQHKPAARETAVAAGS